LTARQPTLTTYKTGAPCKIPLARMFELLLTGTIKNATHIFGNDRDGAFGVRGNPTLT